MGAEAAAVMRGSVGCSGLCWVCHLEPPLQVKNQVREMRTAKEWSQSDLAEKLEVPRQTVNAIENGRYDPSLPLAFKLARLFRVATEDIFVPDKD
jgi:putative transcriptional regulator